MVFLEEEGSIFLLVNILSAPIAAVYIYTSGFQQMFFRTKVCHEAFICCGELPGVLIGTKTKAVWKHQIRPRTGIFMSKKKKKTFFIFYYYYFCNPNNNSNNNNIF